MSYPTSSSFPPNLFYDDSLINHKESLSPTNDSINQTLNQLLYQSSSLGGIQALLRLGRTRSTDEQLQHKAALTVGQLATNAVKLMPKAGVSGGVEGKNKDAIGHGARMMRSVYSASHIPSFPFLHFTDCYLLFLCFVVDCVRKWQLKKLVASLCSNWTLLAPNIPPTLKWQPRKPAVPYDWKMVVPQVHHQQLGQEMKNTNRNEHMKKIFFLFVVMIGFLRVLYTTKVAI